MDTRGEPAGEVSNCNRCASQTFEWSPSCEKLETLSSQPFGSDVDSDLSDGDGDDVHNQTHTSDSEPDNGAVVLLNYINLWDHQSPSKDDIRDSGLDSDRSLPLSPQLELEAKACTVGEVAGDIIACGDHEINMAQVTSIRTDGCFAAVTVPKEIACQGQGPDVSAGWEVCQDSMKLPSTNCDLPSYAVGHKELADDTETLRCDTLSLDAEPMSHSTSSGNLSIASSVAQADHNYSSNVDSHEHNRSINGGTAECSFQPLLDLEVTIGEVKDNVCSDPAVISQKGLYDIESQNALIDMKNHSKNSAQFKGDNQRCLAANSDPDSDCDSDATIMQAKYMHIGLAAAVPSYNESFAAAVPSYNESFAAAVPSYNESPTAAVPSYESPAAAVLSYNESPVAAEFSTSAEQPQLLEHSQVHEDGDHGSNLKAPVASEVVRAKYVMVELDAEGDLRDAITATSCIPEGNNDGNHSQRVTRAVSEKIEYDQLPTSERKESDLKQESVECKEKLAGQGTSELAEEYLVKTQEEINAYKATGQGKGDIISSEKLELNESMVGAEFAKMQSVTDPVADCPLEVNSPLTLNPLLRQDSSTVDGSLLKARLGPTPFGRTPGYKPVGKISFKPASLMRRSSSGVTTTSDGAPQLSAVPPLSTLTSVEDASHALTDNVTSSAFMNIVSPYAPEEPTYSDPFSSSLISPASPQAGILLDSPSTSLDAQPPSSSFSSAFSPCAVKPKPSLASPRCAAQSMSVSSYSPRHTEDEVFSFGHSEVVLQEVERSPTSAGDMAVRLPDVQVGRLVSKSSFLKSSQGSSPRISSSSETAEESVSNPPNMERQHGRKLPPVMLTRRVSALLSSNAELGEEQKPTTLPAAEEDTADRKKIINSIKVRRKTIERWQPEWNIQASSQMPAQTSCQLFSDASITQQNGTETNSLTKLEPDRESSKTDRKPHSITGNSLENTLQKKDKNRFDSPQQSYIEGKRQPNSPAQTTQSTPTPKQESIIERDIRLQKEREETLRKEKEILRKVEEQKAASPMPQSLAAQGPRVPNEDSAQKVVSYASEHPMKSEMKEAQAREAELKISRQMSIADAAQNQKETKLVVSPTNSLHEVSKEASLGTSSPSSPNSEHLSNGGRSITGTPKKGVSPGGKWYTSESPIERDIRTTKEREEAHKIRTGAGSNEGKAGSEREIKIQKK